MLCHNIEKNDSHKHLNIIAPVLPLPHFSLSSKRKDPSSIGLEKLLNPVKDAYSHKETREQTTLPLIQNTISTLTSQDNYQRPQIVSNALILPSPHFSISSKRKDPSLIGLEKLFNPVKDVKSYKETREQTVRLFDPPLSSYFVKPTSCEATPSATFNSVTNRSSIDASVSSTTSPRDLSKADNASDAPRLSKMTTDFLISPSLYLQSQAQNCNRPSNVNLTLPQPASQSGHHNTFAHSQVRGTETIIAPETSFTDQPRSFFGTRLPSFDPSSTMSQADAEVFELPSTSTRTRYPMMTLKTEQGLIWLPVDTQAASKVTDEKRKRDAKASQRFRQRRKEKDWQNTRIIAKLKAELDAITKEKEYYKRERDYFRDVAFHHETMKPRRLLPRSKGHMVLQQPTDVYIPLQDLPSSTVKRFPPAPPFKHTNVMVVESNGDGNRKSP